ncbi:MAG: hypothetical protein IJ867_07445 [Clostridia bacterium]|nr:hypothetical protein [Clostridia bacterium]
MSRLKKGLIVFLIVLVAGLCFCVKTDAINYVLEAYLNVYKYNAYSTVEITAVCNSNWNENTYQAVEICVVPQNSSNTQENWVRIGTGKAGEALNRKYYYNIYQNSTVSVRYVYWWTISGKSNNVIEFYRRSIVVNNVGNGQTASVAKVTNVLPTVNGKTVLVNWNKVDGADGYEVNFTAPGTNVNWTYDWKTVGIYFTSFPIRNGYHVRVRAYKLVNGNKQYGEYSQAVSFDVKGETVTLSKVNNVRTYIYGNRLYIYWDNVNNADGYEVKFTAPGTNINWTYDWKSTGIYFPSFPTRNGYQVTIRAYKTVNGVKQYGEASNVTTFNIQ